MRHVRVRPSGTRRAARVLGNLALNLAAIGGAACVVLTALAVLFDISLIMFRTGSMAPAITAGSVAVVRQVDAHQVRVGDVLTVDRPDALPVTHRVTSVSGAGEQRTITMRGDANETEDPEPYTITQARRVIFAVPGLARPLALAGDPRVMAGITLAAAALVTWAFWPRTGRRDAHQAGRDRDDGDGPSRKDGEHVGAGYDGEQSGGAGRGHAGATPTQESNQSGRKANRGQKPSQGPGRGAHHTAGLIALPLALVAPWAAPMAHAGAMPADDPSATTVTGEVLRIHTIGDPGSMRSMAPGESVPWQVGVWADAPSPGTVAVSWSADGDAELGLHATVRACDERWVDGSCPGAESELARGRHLPWGAGYEPLWQMSSEEQVWLLVEAYLDGVDPSGQVDVVLRASGLGEDVEVGTGPVGAVPATGLTWGPVATALAAIVLGLTLAAVAHARSRRSI